MGQKFFAYGAFSEDQIHYPKISQLVQSAQTAWVRAEAFRLRCGLPALLPSSSADWVEGTLLELNAPETYWSVLDALLGVDRPQSLFLRQALRVKSAEGEQEALTYCLKPDKRDHVQRSITNGDWRQDLRVFPPLLNKLEPQQVDYIRKLASAKGRELVPYKLDVYRALMSLEIIKDKGRRPALTSLGQEIGFFIQ